MDLLNDFSPGLFIIQTFLLLLLIFLMVKFAWKPILNSLNEREEGIKDALDAAEKARKEMESLKADNDKMKQEARQERDAMLKEAQTMKKQIIAEASEEAQKKADEIISKAQTAIQNEKKVAISDLKLQVAKYSVEIAEKVLEHELSDKKKQMKLVDSLVEDVKLN